MCNKKQIFQFTLAVFIVGLTSCEKEMDIQRSQSKIFQNEIVESANTKLGNRNTIKFAMYFDNEIPNEKALSILANFLPKENLAFYIQDLIDTDENAFVYNEENDQFEELNSKIKYNINSKNPVVNHLINLENIYWNIKIYQNVGFMDRAVTSLLVTTICPIGCCDCLCLNGNGCG